MFSQIWLKTSGLTLAKWSIFISIKDLLCFQGPILSDSDSKKFLRVTFYNRKIKYVKTLIHKSDELACDYSQWMKRNVIIQQVLSIIKLWFPHFWNSNRVTPWFVLNWFQLIICCPVALFFSFHFIIDFLLIFNQFLHLDIFFLFALSKKNKKTGHWL